MRFNNYIFYCFTLITLSTPAYGCREIGKTDGSRHTYINRAGLSCLTFDIYQPEASWLNWEAGFGHINGLLVVNELDCKRPAYNSQEWIVNHFEFDIDLQQHSLSSESKRIDGIYQSCFGSSIKVHDGNIKDVQTGVFLILGQTKYPQYPDISKMSVAYEDFPLTSALDKTLPEYVATNHSIENMNINATHRGVNIYGGKNIIRNSSIEVDGHTAIYMAGPNPVIENNTIIIHGKGRTNLRTSDDAVELMKGAIKLRDAKGGIIRNNKIIYKGGFLGFGKAPVAINLLDSKDVLIEGNTIEGFDKLVRENGDTSYTENNNTIK